MVEFGKKEASHVQTSSRLIEDEEFLTVPVPKKPSGYEAGAASDIQGSKFRPIPIP